MSDQRRMMGSCNPGCFHGRPHLENSQCATGYHGFCTPITELPACDHGWNENLIESTPEGVVCRRCGVEGKVYR